QEALQEGRQEGIAIGEQQGERKREAAVLTRQLQRRFGVLPSWASERIAQADLATLERWSLRILETTTLGDVITDLS
ncbi:MAG: DUF4351 domain-containing protein, partial [Magnetococcales bacterium]|nr:DUF4351 domain-containing protein [Magnetococcales bacterium]